MIGLDLDSDATVKFITRLLVIFTLVALAASCSMPATAPTLPGLPRASSMPLATTSAPAVPSRPSPTFTRTVPTPTAAATETLRSFLTPALNPEAKLRYGCLDRTAFPDATVELEGRLMFAALGQRPPFLLDLNTQAEIELGFDGLNWVVSPDRRWVSFLDIRGERRQIAIMDAAGRIEGALTAAPGWLGPIEWLNNGELVVVKSAEPLNDVLFLTPFSWQQRQLSSHYPDIYMLTPFSWGVSPRTVFSPDASMVVYPEDGPRAYILRDIQNDHEITRIAAYSVLTSPPAWSPDGASFVFANFLQEPVFPVALPMDLFSVDTNGQIARLTHLSEQFSNSIIQSYAWSPDGRHIAFWMAADYPSIPGSDWRDYMDLAILDLTTQEVTLLCLRAYWQDSEWPPIWSPSRNQIMVKSKNELGKAEITIVDLDQDKAVIVTGDERPIGWLRTTP